MQGEAAPVVPRKEAQRQRAEPHAENHGRDRQGREAFVGREHGTNDTGGGNDHRIVAAGQRLRDREHDRVAARERVIGLNVLKRFGCRRHKGLPEAAPFSGDPRKPPMPPVQGRIERGLPLAGRANRPRGFLEGHRAGMANARFPRLGDRPGPDLAQ